MFIILYQKLLRFTIQNHQICALKIPRAVVWYEGWITVITKLYFAKYSVGVSLNKSLFVTGVDRESAVRLF